MTPADIHDRKQAIREQALAQRDAQPDKDELSKLIVGKLIALPAYRTAQVILYYVDARSEVRTRHELPLALGFDKKIVVPYCVEGELQLFHLTSMDELDAGAYRILEPRPERRGSIEKKVDVREVDLIVVPGVAFDRGGARLGHGFGYYDKLLPNTRADTVLAGLAFECQLFDAIPTQAHDVVMDWVITQKEVYAGKGRRKA